MSEILIACPSREACL